MTGPAEQRNIRGNVIKPHSVQPSEPISEEHLDVEVEQIEKIEQLDSDGAEGEVATVQADGSIATEEIEDGDGGGDTAERLAYEWVGI